MKSKIFILRIIYFNLFLLGVVLIVNIFLINPSNGYNYINFLDVTNHKLKYDKFTAKIVYEKLKKEKATLIFGTSRSALVSSEMLNEKVFNLNGLYGNPFSVYSFLESLDEVQIKNINKVYYLVDTHILKSSDHLKYGLRDVNYKNYFLSFIEMLQDGVSMNRLYDSLNCFKSNYITKDNSQYVDKYGGYIVVNNKQNKYFQKYEYSKYTFDNDYFEYTNEALEVLAKINQFFQEKKIEVVYFTATFSPYFFYNMNMENEFQKYSNVLLKIGKIHFLQYLDNISERVENNYLVNFSDPSHLNYKSLNYIMNDVIESKAYFVKNEEELKKIFLKLENKKELLHRKNNHSSN